MFHHIYLSRSSNISQITLQPTLNTKVSLKTGFSVFLCTLVSNFFFLSGSRNTFTYGSDVPDMSMPGRSAAWITPTDNYKQRNGIHVTTDINTSKSGDMTITTDAKLFLQSLVGEPQAQDVRWRKWAKIILEFGGK